MVQQIVPPHRSTLDLADRLHSSAIHLLRWLREVDADSPATGTQLSALSVIVFKGPLSLKTLAEAEQVRPPSMSRLVGALEAKGLVRRTEDPDDRRAVSIHATRKGERVLGNGRKRRLERLAGELQRLDPEARATLAGAVTELDRMIPRR